MWRNEIEPYFSIYSNIWSNVAYAREQFLTLEGVHNLFYENKKQALLFK